MTRPDAPFLSRVEPLIGPAPAAGVDEARAYRQRMVDLYNARTLPPELQRYLRRRIRDWRDRANGHDHRWALVGAKPGVLPARLRVQVQHAADYDAPPSDDDLTPM
jgi:hypothetical protein